MIGCKPQFFDGNLFTEKCARAYTSQIILGNKVFKLAKFLGNHGNKVLRLFTTKKFLNFFTTKK